MNVCTSTWLSDINFSVAGPPVWNSLPSTLRQLDMDFGQLKRLLMTFLARDAFVRTNRSAIAMTLFSHFSSFSFSFSLTKITLNWLKPRRTWLSNASSHHYHVIFVLPMWTSTPVLDWVTEVSLLLDHESGTFYPALCDSLTWTLDSWNNYLRHVCLSETAVHL